jgi:hypothetical protein
MLSGAKHLGWMVKMMQVEILSPRECGAIVRFADSE